jgi:2-oxoacid:acceptor oxidoreductase delta subunit (pyruvate/2-ketoisovalerate family)
MAKTCEIKPKENRRPRPPLPKKRPDFSSVERGLRKEEAVKEARRCLALRECDSCELCSLLCPDLCITRDPSTGGVLIDLDYCKGCGLCAFVCPKGAIKMVPEERMPSEEPA